MGRRSGSREGICHLCGTAGPLTFEHVPPRAAFNDQPVVRATFEAVKDLDPEAQVKGPVEQRGAGDYTLCASCNNLTGKWYGNAFAHWCEQGMRILLAARGRPGLVYPIHTLPLQVIKQVVTMFMSVNGPNFQAVHPELVRFVLNRRARFLSPRYRFFVYFTSDARTRFFGLSIASNLASGRMTALSEIAFPPFGYVMTIDSAPPDSRLCEITDFARYAVSDFKDVNLGIRALPTVAMMPGDYRTLDEVRAARRKAEEFKRRRAEQNAAGRSEPGEDEQSRVDPERMVRMLEQVPRLYARLTGGDEG